MGLRKKKTTTRRHFNPAISEWQITRLHGHGLQFALTAFPEVAINSRNQRKIAWHSKS
jgi:hypothetical protein